MKKQVVTIYFLIVAIIYAYEKSFKFDPFSSLFIENLK